MSRDLSPRFDHTEAEERIYDLWERSGFFNPDYLPKQSAQNLSRSFLRKIKKFCIVMPPPNANGALHIGHALFVTLQDIMVRYYRMRGYRTLWLPGADHAGFETQVVYEKKLEKEGRSRFQMSREELYREIWNFTQENKKTMERQLRKLGASCDWSRGTFTLDEKVIEGVYATFKKLYDDGLVYRGRRIVNWCSKHQTSLSDLEVKDETANDTLYYLRYGPFTIATARPETKFGDKIIVVHPEDKRYAKHKDGDTFEFEWINGPITATLVKDEAIDMAFGTGAMTITPWHDAADFEIAARHNLAGEQIIDWQGKLLPVAGEFAGEHIKKARPLIVEKMKAEGLLVKTESYTHTVPSCFKCGTPIEPQIRDQWYVAMTKKPSLGNASLRDMAVAAVKKDAIKFVPDHMEKIFLHWMENLRDWNVSRQIVWGIRIPAWFCRNSKEEKTGGQDEGNRTVPEANLVQTAGSRESSSPPAKLCSPIITAGEKPEKCPQCGSVDLAQDPDVFDTWFSSGEWPFITLGYPDDKDFKNFYPTDVIETAADILFFWVARMIMLSCYRTGKIPFKTVYLHGLVRDKDRQKMSKSKGNVIDPLGIAAEYGTDAVRAALIAGNTPGRDTAISEDKIRGYRNFATKIWNVARFVLANAPETDPDKFANNTRVSVKNKKRLKELDAIKKKVAGHTERFEFYLALETAYHYVWHTFADKIIEEAKPQLRDGSEREKEAARVLLDAILVESLKMLHPFMPFITEEIYQHLRPGKVLMAEPWETGKK